MTVKAAVFLFLSLRLAAPVLAHPAPVPVEVRMVSDEVEAFQRAVAEGRLRGEEAERQGDVFFGVQGPWYTVGWRMAATIEKAFGRPALLACVQDPRRLLPTFNRAVAVRKETCATWSPELLRCLSGRAG